MKKHHAKHKKGSSASKDETRLSSARQAGFLRFNLERFMSRKDRTLIIIVALGVLALIVASIYIIVVNNKAKDKQPEDLGIDPKKVITTPYPTIPQEIKDTTVLINSRGILPDVVTIIVGGSVGFFNETNVPVVIEAYGNTGEILDIGPVAPYDVPVVVFDTPGTYEYINPQNPQDVAQIIVE